MRDFPEAGAHARGGGEASGGCHGPDREREGTQQQKGRQGDSHKQPDTHSPERTERIFPYKARWDPLLHTLKVAGLRARLKAKTYPKKKKRSSPLK